jgi:hypothetical protein
MVKHEHREFPSDIFTLFVAAGVRLRIGKLLLIYPN